MRNEPRIENKDVMFNLMLCDKQIQDLHDNHMVIKDMRGKQKHFSDLVETLKKAPSGPASRTGSREASMEKHESRCQVDSRAGSEASDSARAVSAERLAHDRSYIPSADKGRGGLIAIHERSPVRVPLKLLPVL